MNTVSTSAATAVPRRSLTVLSGGARAHDGFQTTGVPSPTRWLASLPVARRVLAIGCQPALRYAYLAAHPGAQWTDVPEAAVLPSPPPETYDLIVLGCGLRQRDDPREVFEALAQHASPGGALMLELENQASLAHIERLIEADCTAPGPVTGHDASLALTPATAIKCLMDAGWMPNMAAQQDRGPVSAALASAAWGLADALNIPRGTASRLLRMEKLLIEASRTFGAGSPLPSQPSSGRFMVVVPTTREAQLQRNVEASPGLLEVEARIVSYRHARSPAEALDASLVQSQGDAESDADWVLLCHQDVYFPRGFGHRLMALLAEVPAAERDRTLIGFVGMAVDAARQGFEPAGFVIDRLERVDHPASDSALSIDELAVVVSRRSIHRIDPSLGWHLWATDLCLAAVCKHKVFPRIVRLPLFHNSINDFQLPRAFYESAALLKQKYASFGPIPTLCGTLDDRFIADGLAASRSPAS